MVNILKDIRLNCVDCDSPENVVRFLYERGDFSYTSEYHREIYFFFLESLKHYKSQKKARANTLLMFKISRITLWSIIKKYGYPKLLS